MGGDGGRSVSFRGEEGVLVVRDRVLFRPGHESFCRRFARQAVGLGGVRSAFVSLATGQCRLEFELGRYSPGEMAEWFAEAVRATVGQAEPLGLDGDVSSTWVSLRVADDGSTWETTREGRRTFRLRHSAIAGDRAEARRVASRLADVPGVESARVTLWQGLVELTLIREGVCASEALALADGACRQVSAEAGPLAVASPDFEAPQVATGWKRVAYLALAGGSFVLTLVGVVVPGVPTVPFLLATSYFLVRSSPRWNERLLRSQFFGPILADLEYGHGLRPQNKAKLVGFTLAVVALTLVFMSPTWPTLLVMLVVTTISLRAIVNIPALPAGEEPGPAALPALA